MNRNGAKWVQKNFDVIVGKIKENAEKLGVPWNELGVRTLLRACLWSEMLFGKKREPV